LRSYFETDGAAAVYVIEIPPGSYVPVAQDRPLQPSSEEPVNGLAPEPAPDYRTTSIPRILAAALVLMTLLSLFLAVLAWKGNAWKSHPSEKTLWGQLTSPNQQTDLVLADSNIGLLQDLTRRNLTLSDYLTGTFTRWAEEYPDSSNMNGVLSTLAARPHTGLADAYMVRQALLNSSYPQNISIYFARNFSARSLKSDNVILFGSKRSNLWLELFEDKLNWRFSFSPATGREVLVSTTRINGKPLIYNASPPPGGAGTGYCQVAFLSNPERTGRVLIIAGTNALATEEGGSLIGPEGDSRLRAALSLARSAPFPYFEIVLRTRYVGGSANGFEILYAKVF
jgi:hypothetical protein